MDRRELADAMNKLLARRGEEEFVTATYIRNNEGGWKRPSGLALDVWCEALGIKNRGAVALPAPRSRRPLTQAA